MKSLFLASTCSGETAGQGVVGAHIVAFNPETGVNALFQQTGLNDALGAVGVGPLKPGWVTDPAARKRYVEAFQRSDFDAMLNYYKRNYPRGAGADAPPAPELPKVTAPVLMFHGLGDRALHSDGLSGTWNWLEKDLTLVTIPNAGHFVQQDAAELVTSTMDWWLTMRARR